MRVILAALVLSGCASVSTQLPDIALPQLTLERNTQEVMAFDEMEQLQTRLMRVGMPVLKANTDLCPKVRQDIGAFTHTVKSYSKSMREAARRELGATSEPSIRLVVDGSAADVAGLQIGDQILDAAGKPISAFDKALQIQLKQGGNIRLKRAGKDIDAVLKSETVCGYKLRLSQTATINAYADGNNITITSGMMNFVKDDDELALIIGHELGHNTMGHIRKIISNIILSVGGTRYTRPFETEADYVGMYYMVRAGYNPDNVEDVWRRLAVTNPKSVARAKTHPTYPNRYLSLAATRAEIKAKQTAGLPLLPNFKKAAKKDNDKS